MQLFVKGQWWSNLWTQLSQSRQWEDLGGRKIKHVRHQRYPLFTKGVTCAGILLLTKWWSFVTNSGPNLSQYFCPVCSFVRNTLPKMVNPAGYPNSSEISNSLPRARMTFLLGRIPGSVQHVVPREHTTTQNKMMVKIGIMGVTLLNSQPAVKMK